MIGRGTVGSEPKAKFGSIQARAPWMHTLEALS